MEHLNLLSNAVFKVNTPSGSGSSFFVKSKNILVTNYHVVKGFRKVSIEDNNKNRYLAEVILINPENDIAFLKTNSNLDTYDLIFGNPLELKSRDEVFVLGYPFGMPYTITKGIISSPKQLMGGKHYIQTDAAVNPGNSGGPIINKNGEIVGITTSKFVGESTDNVGFAIPYNLLNDDLNSLIENGKQEFCVKCSSCNNLIYKKTDYCNKCGKSINKELFDEVTLSKIGEVIEKIIEELGFEVIICRSGSDYWTFHFEQLLIRIFIFSNEYVYITSPITTLPKNNLEEFYKFVFSPNITPYKIGISEEILYVSYRTHIVDIFSSDKNATIKNIKEFPAKASEITNYLIKNFDVKLSNYTKD